MTRLIMTYFLLVIGTSSTHANQACPNLLEPENGMLSITSQENIHLSSAMFTCNSGYWIHGHIKLCCSEGKWNEGSEVPTSCVPIGNSNPSCKSPIMNNNDYHYLTMKGTFLNGGNLQLSCLSVDGFVNTQENQTLSCLNGVWDLPPIKCNGPPIPTDRPMADVTDKSNLVWYIIAGVAVVVLCILVGVGVCVLCHGNRTTQDDVHTASHQDRAYENRIMPDDQYEMVDNPEYGTYAIPQLPPYNKQESHKYDYLNPIIPTVTLSELETEEEIGKDQGVSLYKGTVILPGSTRTQDVVIKVSKDDFTRNQMTSLRREIEQLRKLGQHQNVIQTVAVISNGPNDCIGIISEYATKGSLRNILQKRKRMSNYSKSVYQILTYVKDIAKGLQYLHTQKFLQPNLKASKVLVFSNNGVCKISNLGLKQLSTEQNLYDLDQPGKKCRPSWFAPEAVTDKVLSIQTDIWTFGATLYEIFSFGEDPFKNLSDEDVVTKLSIDTNSSERTQPIFTTPPILCKYPSTKDIFKLICQCCHWKQSERPGFRIILSKIETALVNAKKHEYVNVEHNK